MRISPVTYSDHFYCVLRSCVGAIAHEHTGRSKNTTYSHLLSRKNDRESSNSFRGALRNVDTASLDSRSSSHNSVFQYLGIRSASPERAVARSKQENEFRKR